MPAKEHDKGLPCGVRVQASVEGPVSAVSHYVVYLGVSPELDFSPVIRH